MYNVGHRRQQYKSRVQLVHPIMRPHRHRTFAKQTGNMCNQCLQSAPK
jgi:hypothetical protein